MQFPPVRSTDAIHSQGASLLRGDCEIKRGVAIMNCGSREYVNRPQGGVGMTTLTLFELVRLTWSLFVKGAQADTC